MRRIIDVSGLDVELASSVSPSALARRDNLDLFVRAVSDFRAVDGEVSLPALLSYLDAEDEEAGGMEIATPTAADTVKLLDRPPRQGAGVGRGLRRRSQPHQVPQRQRPSLLGHHRGGPPHLAAR